MHVDEANPSAHQHMSFDEEEDFVVVGLGSDGKRVKQCNDLSAFGQVAASQFAQDERMYDDLPSLKQSRKGTTRSAEVVNPD